MCCPQFVYGVGQGNGPVVACVCGVTFFVQEDCLTLLELWGGVSCVPHALDEGVQVLVYDVWGTFEQFIGYAIWSWCFVACQVLHSVPECSV